MSNTKASIKLTCMSVVAEMKLDKPMDYYTVAQSFYEWIVEDLEENQQPELSVVTPFNN